MLKQQFMSTNSKLDDLLYLMKDQVAVEEVRDRNVTKRLKVIF